MATAEKRGIFIAGTDTGAGKTFVTAALMNHYANACKSVAVVKPIQTGCSDSGDDRIAPDICAYQLARMGQGTKVSFHCFEKFKAPCAPNVAARMEGKSIDMDALLRRTRAVIGASDMTLIEGAGGIFTPLDERRNTMADFMERLAIPIVVAAPNRIGVINHVHLTVNELMGRNLKICAIVLTQTMEMDGDGEFLLDSNGEEIRAIFPRIACKVIGHIRRKKFYQLSLDEGRDEVKEENVAEAIVFDRAHVIHPYDDGKNPGPVEWANGTCGAEIHCHGGVTLVDGISSWWSAIHGYNHPHLKGAMERQLQSMPHVMFAGFTHGPAVELGRQLLRALPSEFGKIFYSDSGSVAVEVALKMAVQWAIGKGKPGKGHFFSLKGAYHGDTHWAMSVSDSEKMHGIFQEILPGQIFLPQPHVPFGEHISFGKERERYESFFEKHHRKIAALILEPIAQCGGGFWFYSADYLDLFRRLCDDYDMLLIADEIATGFGRTGKLFAFQWSTSVPHILCLGKGLTGGCVSLAVTAVANSPMEVISDVGPFMHGPTFMANPLACAAACASLELFADETWRVQVQAIEAFLKMHWLPMGQMAGVRTARVLGTMAALEMELPVDGAAFCRHCISRGVWLRPIGNVIYTMPCFAISSEQLGQIIKAIREWIEVN
jgi:adenosylmethionine-8-amino-7-oxononanoate aminotransferase